MKRKNHYVKEILRQKRSDGSGNIVGVRLVNRVLTPTKNYPFEKCFKSR